ncbi:MAG TPA: hypothetical protein P5210_06805 [Draconibacterium sp.]|nr:hypothetical protein [Draconibacterium sp.]
MLICTYDNSQHRKTGLYYEFSFYEWMEIYAQRIVFEVIAGDSR